MEGNILVSHPLMHDQFFRRSVIYLTNHSNDGALGFMLNYKTNYKIRDIKPEIKNGNFPIYEGGPVAKNQLFYIHKLGDNLSDSIKIKNDIYFGGDFYQLMHMLEHGKIKPYEIRFFAGYSGWGIGQLENEIKSNHWLVNNNVESDFFGNDPQDLWRLQLTEIKNSFGVFAEFGNDPSLN